MKEMESRAAAVGLEITPLKDFYMVRGTDHKMVGRPCMSEIEVWEMIFKREEEKQKPKKELTLEVRVPAEIYNNLAIIADKNAVNVEEFISVFLKSCAKDFSTAADNILKVG